MAEVSLFIAVDFLKDAFGLHARCNGDKIEIFFYQLVFLPREMARVQEN